MKKVSVQFLLVIAVVLSASYAFTQPRGDGDRNQKFSQHKAEIVSDVDSEIQKLQEMKSCVSQAKSPDEMRSCHDSLEQFRRSQREKHLQRRKAEIDEELNQVRSENAPNRVMEKR